MAIWNTVYLIRELKNAITLIKKMQTTNLVAERNSGHGAWDTGCEFDNQISDFIKENEEIANEKI